MPSPVPSPETRERIQRLLLAVLLAFAGVGIMLAYWAVVRNPTILAREDNPRLVETELRIERGRIFDVHNVLLAETVGSGNDLVRHYPIPQIGPVVGYYSFRHGTAGIEDGLNGVLRGDSQSAWEMNRRQLLHENQTGYDVRLTLNAIWQEQATALMDGRHGALVLLALPDAAVRAMVSLPGFDPNQLDEQFDELMADEQAPLLNRATQGQYQPGMVLQPFLYAAALDQGIFRLNDPTTNLTQTVPVANNALTCTVPAIAPNSYLTALRYACPAPTQTLSQTWDAAALQSVFSAFTLASAPILPFPIELPSQPPVQNIPLALIGQENLTVTPLQVALALSALANDGQPLTPQLVNAVQNDSGTWEAYLTRPQSPLPVAVSAAAANDVLDALGKSTGVAGQSYAVLSGPEGSTNSWYMGVAPIANPRFVVVVVLEGETDEGVAAAIGETLLRFLMTQS